MILIFIQSSLSNLKLPDIAWKFTDKLIHFFVFGLLGWLLARGMQLAKTAFMKKHSVIFALTIGVLFAASDEWHQMFVPGRQADWLDLLFDCLGIVSFVIYYRRQSRSAQNRLVTPDKNL